MGEALDHAKRHGLRGSCRYTCELYTRKISAVLHKTPTYEYRRMRSALADALASSLCRYIASITLFLEKKQTYSQGESQDLTARPKVVAEAEGIASQLR